MRRGESKTFAEFLLDEATKYRVPITPREIELWFETFERCSLEDFKAAWIQHKRDEKRGPMFPKIPWLQRLLRVTGEENAARDWRCSVEVNGERCGYPGGLNAGQGWQCSAHYRLKGSAAYTDQASLQIIEASRAYVAPKMPMEAMERGAAQREGEGARWRGAGQRASTKRLPGDELDSRLPAKPDGPPLDDVPLPEFTPIEEAAS